MTAAFAFGADGRGSRPKWDPVVLLAPIYWLLVPTSFVIAVIRYEPVDFLLTIGRSSLYAGLALLVILRPYRVFHYPRPVEWREVRRTGLLLFPIMISLTLVANGALDFDAAEKLEGVVEIKFTRNAGRGTSHFLEVSLPGGRSTEPKPGNQTWSAAVEGKTPVALNVKPGFFGMPWIESYDILVP